MTRNPKGKIKAADLVPGDSFMTSCGHMYYAVDGSKIDTILSEDEVFVLIRQPFDEVSFQIETMHKETEVYHMGRYGE